MGVGPFGLERVELTQQEASDLAELMNDTGLNMKADDWQAEYRGDRVSRISERVTEALAPILEAQGFEPRSSTVGIGTDGLAIAWARRKGSVEPA